MRTNLLLKTNIFFGATFLAIAIFVLLLLLGGGSTYWYGLLIVLIILQLRFKISVSSLFPIIAILSLTEYYFFLSGKRIYLCELVFAPLIINYILTDFLWKPLNKTDAILSGKNGRESTICSQHLNWSKPSTLKLCA